MIHEITRKNSKYYFEINEEYKNCNCNNLIELEEDFTQCTDCQ